MMILLYLYMCAVLRTALFMIWLLNPWSVVSDFSHREKRNTVTDSDLHEEYRIWMNGGMT